MQIIFLPPARRELADAALYYQRIQPGLGDRLLREAADHFALVRANPTGPRLRKGGYRRVNCKTFPYYIAYGIENGDIVVFAFAHSAREPEYWIRRMR